MASSGEESRHLIRKKTSEKRLQERNDFNYRQERRPKQSVLAASSIVLEGASNEAASSKAGTIAKKTSKEGRVLDGFLLLDTCKVEFPEEVNEVILVGLCIKKIVGDDLFFFSNLTRMDISDNEASLEPLQNLPALVELIFQCNALQQLSTVEGGFPKLEVLNLSHNCLTCRDFAQLAKIKRLRELYLGNNRIRSVPRNFGDFAQLELLFLEYNSLHDPNCFSMLSLAPNLRSLNVSHNRLAGVPETGNNGFLRLEDLDLTYNKIMKETQVYPLLYIRTLRRLDLHGNPLTDAACHVHDQTKLLYDPVPAMTYFLNENAQAGKVLTILLAYPEYKSKRLQQSSYEHTHIYKMMPNDIPLSTPFHSRATQLLIQQGRSDKSISPKKSSYVTKPVQRRMEHELDDFTIATSAGNKTLTNFFTSIQPGVMVAANNQTFLSSLTSVQSGEQSRLQSLRGENAAKALQYYLKNPLTAHDDADLIPRHSQKPTLAHLQQRRSKKVHQQSQKIDNSEK